LEGPIDFEELVGKILDSNRAASGEGRMEDEIPKKEKLESPEHHKSVAAIDKQNEAVELIAARVEALTNQISADNRADELATERRQTAQMCLNQRFLRWQQIGVIVSGLLAVLTLVVLTVTLVKTSDLAENAATQSKIMRTQADIMTKTLPDMDEQARAAGDSASAARTAAQSAETANRLSQQAFIIGESPYVYINDSILRPLRAGRKAAVDVEIENRGKLAAEAFTSSGIVELRTSDPTGINVGATSNPAEVPPSIPRKLTFFSNDPINKDQLKAIRRGILTLFVYGMFDYQNTLAQGAVTIDSFCSSYNPASGPKFVPCKTSPKLVVNGRIINMSPQSSQ